MDQDVASRWKGFLGIRNFTKLNTGTAQIIEIGWLYVRMGFSGTSPRISLCVTGLPIIANDIFRISRDIWQLFMLNMYKILFYRISFALREIKSIRTVQISSQIYLPIYSGVCNMYWSEIEVMAG